jgi:hypothetical protein
MAQDKNLLLKIAVAVCTLSVIAILFLAFVGRPEGLALEDVNTMTARIPNIFGSLLLVSLFIERVIEVFVSLWEDEETEKMELQIDFLQSKQVTLKKLIDDLTERLKSATDDVTKTDIEKRINARRDEMEAAMVDANNVEKDLIPKNAATRKLSTWFGMAIGILTAAVGFRFLNQIVDLSRINSHSLQYAAFIMADILLTGTVLAGGSKAIHSIFSVYDEFMDATRKKAEMTKASANA